VDRGLRRVSLALVAAVVVAEAAVLLLRPRSGIIDPAQVSAPSYFSRAQIDRARDFRRPNLALFALSLGVEAGVLVLVLRRPPRFVRAPDRALLRAAAAGSALTAALSVVGLPIAAVLRQRSIDVGLSTQSWGGWAVDQVKALGIGAALSAGGGLLFVAMVRRMPRWWWAPASGAVVVLGAAFLFAGPVLLDPIFNKFTLLPEGRTRASVLELAHKAGVKVGQVYEVDASRRTTAANAYVTGLGATKRVVIYDTLLKDFSPEEVDLVVAHELGHVHYADVPRGLLFLLVVAPVSLYAAKRLIEAWLPDPAARRTALMVPAGALALGIVSFGVSTVSNQLSRAIEARADTYALQLTDAPEPFIGFERRITVQNVADPDPPGWLTFLLATHPPTVERIGAGVAFQRGERAVIRAWGASGPDPAPRTPEGS
jgi:Zn-dependent protease with chaperone function